MSGTIQEWTPRFHGDTQVNQLQAEVQRLARMLEETKAESRRYQERLAVLMEPLARFPNVTAWGEAMIDTAAQNDKLQDMLVQHERMIVRLCAAIESQPEDDLALMQVTKAARALLRASRPNATGEAPSADKAGA